MHTVSTTLQKNSVMSALGSWVLWGNSSGLALVVILPQLEGSPLAGEVNRTRGTHTCGWCELPLRRLPPPLMSQWSVSRASTASWDWDSGKGRV